MSDYKIIGFDNHNITLEFDGTKMNFVLPIVDGKYPEGAALTRLLDAYVSNTRAERVNVVASNIDNIRALIEQPTLTTAQLIEAKKATRGRLLVFTDWTTMPDSPLSASEKTAWQQYRQELRDLTSQSGFPQAIVWPIPPKQIISPMGLAATMANGTPLI